VGRRASVCVLVKRKSHSPVGIRTPDRPARSLVTVPSTLSCLIVGVVLFQYKACAVADLWL
jgi:hypothetical protein